LLADNQETKEGQTVVSSEVISEHPSTRHLYMDIHRNVKDLTEKGLYDAHLKDLAVQSKYDVSYHRYWFEEKTGTIFCLVEAPSKEAAMRVHEEAHGLVADELIEVSSGH